MIPVAIGARAESIGSLAGGDTTQTNHCEEPQDPVTSFAYGHSPVHPLSYRMHARCYVGGKNLTTMV